jgi:carboxyl-terminal processing protease
VDLRGNLGGDMWPMLAGLGPLEGASQVGFTVDANDHKDAWFSDANGAGIDRWNGKREVDLWMAEGEEMSLDEMPAVAILMDRGTASSGEAIAVSFAGRPNCRSFGRHTHGQTTANEGFGLSDGANLVLTTAFEADRTGHVYRDGLTPDVELPQESARTAPDSIDPMTQEAATWIKNITQTSAGRR